MEDTKDCRCWGLEEHTEGRRKHPRREMDSHKVEYHQERESLLTNAIDNDGTDLPRNWKVIQARLITAP